MLNDEEINEIILEPDPARVMEGLRDTGYDFNTAMADLIDNSIAASATKIKVRVQINPNNDFNVYIADNGCGMDINGLKNAMRYGSAERKDPSSLGKFGLGLKTASTAFCRSLSLISKGDNNEYNKVRWDLDEICKINKWKLLTPEIEDSEIDMLEEVTDGGTGTLVVWDKVDRLMKEYSDEAYRNKAFSKLVNNLKRHLSMTYQRFLEKSTDGKIPHIELYLNDEKLEPWDPFCSSEPHATKIAETEVEVENEIENIKFHLAAWLLPKKELFSSLEAYNKAHITNDMEGFYIYRENRLIHHGDWLEMFVKDPHLSLLRVELSFDHRLDDAFNVDIKKSRILLNNEIYDFIKEQFMPAPRRAADELYRKGKIEEVKATSKGAHEASNNNINSKASIVEDSKINVIDSNTGEVEISNTQGTFKGIIKIKTSTEPGQCRVIPVDSIDDGLLWEPTIVDGNHAVSINQSHDYYSKVYAPNLGNSSLIIGMDALLWSLAEAEMATYNDAVKEQYEDMRMEVSKILRKLVKDLPDPDVKDEI